MCEIWSKIQNRHVIRGSRHQACFFAVLWWFMWSARAASAYNRVGKWMKGVAEYLAIFTCLEASTVVWSQPAEQGKLIKALHPICIALVRQRIWVVCQTVMNWCPFSVREPEDHHVNCPVLGLDEAGNRARNQMVYIWWRDHWAKTKEKSQNTVTVTEETAYA